MSPLPVESERELSVGGFQGIKKIRGLLVDIDVVNPPDTWTNQEKQVVVVKMEDTVVHEMFGDEEPFELKDGKFSFYIPYVEAGKKPHQNSIYSKCWLDSASEVGYAQYQSGGGKLDFGTWKKPTIQGGLGGKKPSEFIGSYAALEKQPRLLFQKPVIDPATKKATLDEDGKKILEDILAVDQSGRPNHFCFVADGEATSDDLNDYIRNLVVGLNQKAALRKLLIDQKAKQNPIYKEMLNNGTLADMLELVIVDDKFQKVEEEKESVET